MLLLFQINSAVCEFFVSLIPRNEIRKGIVWSRKVKLGKIWSWRLSCLIFVDLQIWPLPSVFSFPASQLLLCQLVPHKCKCGPYKPASYVANIQQFVQYFEVSESKCRSRVVVFQVISLGQMITSKFDMKFWYLMLDLMFFARCWNQFMNSSQQRS